MSKTTTPTGAHIVLGTGPLGRATAKALVTRGHDTRLVNRGGRMPDRPAGTDLIAADLTDRTSWPAITTGAAAIYFCVQPPYHLWPEQFPALQSAAIDMAALCGAPLIVAENMYAYGPVDGLMTEDLPLVATTRKGATRARMHKALMAAHAEGGIAVAVARGSDFFGPGVTEAALGASVFDAIARGRTVRVLGDPDLPHSYTFVPDFGEAMAILGTDPRAIGQVWHVPNAPVRTTRELIEAAAQIAGTRPRIAAIGPWQLRALSLVVPALREMVELAYQQAKPFVVDHGRFATTFGNIATPLDAALNRTLRSTAMSREPDRRRTTA